MKKKAFLRILTGILLALVMCFAAACELPFGNNNPPNGAENSTEKPDDSTEKPDSSTEKPDDSTEKPDPTEKPDDSTEKPDPTEKPNGSTGNPDDSTGDSSEGNQQTKSKFPKEGSSDSSAPIKVLLLANNEETRFYEEYFESLEEKYGVEITLNTYDASAYYQILDREILCGTPPDIFYLRPNEILQYVDEIYCLDRFKDTVKDNENLMLDLSEIYPFALNLYKCNDETKKMDANGELYAFPKDLITQQLGYNKALLEKYKAAIKAEYSEKNPTEHLKLPWEMDFEHENYTWKDYQNMCEAIQKAANDANDRIYASDIPDIEVLVKSYGGSILNTSTMKVQITSNEVQQAYNLQKSLCYPSGRHDNYAAADFEHATQANFQGGKVAFYGAVGSWEVAAYDNALRNERGPQWGVMPWPTVDGSTNWYGKITSSGLVVSNRCKNWETAMEIAASFMTRKVQQKMVAEKRISIPMNTKLINDYLDPDNDAMYHPSTRKIFIDVISGVHGFRPAEYSTFKDGWMKPMSDELQKMWKGNKNITLNSHTQKNMQDILDNY